MLGYKDFYEIAKEGNKLWKGSFTEKEIALNAYDYLVEYEISYNEGKPTHTMIELCKLIVEDMDFIDYENTNTLLELETMDRVLKEFLEEI